MWVCPDDFFDSGKYHKMPVFEKKEHSAVEYTRIYLHQALFRVALVIKTFAHTIIQIGQSIDYIVLYYQKTNLNLKISQRTLFVFF